MSPQYRGRIAPSPTGFLHLGHARTFWTAQERATSREGALILRSDDLDHGRCREEYAQAMLDDLRWLGLHWVEGPDAPGDYSPYNQSERMPHYIAAFEWLRRLGAIYPCFCSRRDILQAINAPHVGEEEPVYPGSCRPPDNDAASVNDSPRAGLAWRFRVPDGEAVAFSDGRLGLRSQTAGVDFGDFVIWRKDDVPSYQLACVVDDAAMQITEVVRGEDLVTSTFRQLLLYRALGLMAPDFYHCELVTDETGQRLAKRDDARALRTLREVGLSPEDVRLGW